MTHVLTPTNGDWIETKESAVMGPLKRNRMKRTAPYLHRTVDSALWFSSALPLRCRSRCLHSQEKNSDHEPPARRFPGSRLIPVTEVCFA